MTSHMTSHLFASSRRQGIQQSLMNPAEATVAHDEYMIAKARGVRDRRDERVDAVECLGLVAKRRERFGQVPAERVPAVR